MFGELVVRCDRPGCEHEVLVDPRAVYGSTSAWPSEGRSERFRCVCGHRVTLLAYTRTSPQATGPAMPASITIWF